MVRCSEDSRIGALTHGHLSFWPLIRMLSGWKTSSTHPSLNQLTARHCHLYRNLDVNDIAKAKLTTHYSACYVKRHYDKGTIFSNLASSIYSMIQLVCNILWEHFFSTGAAIEPVIGSFCRYVSCIYSYVRFDTFGQYFIALDFTYQ